MPYRDTSQCMTMSQSHHAPRLYLRIMRAVVEQQRLQLDAINKKGTRDPGVLPENP